jgi:hypothetical protein
MGIDRRLMWETADGRCLTLVQIGDDHLKNIIRHIKIYGEFYDPWVLETMEDETRRRGFIEIFVPPIQPWRDDKGTWRVGWNPQTGEYDEFKPN